MRKIFSVIPLVIMLAACGNSGSAKVPTYSDAAAVARAAGFTDCSADDNTLASDTVTCDRLNTGIDGISDDASVDWFKSVQARDQWKKLADVIALGGVILYGGNWAIECGNKAQCDYLAKRMGGTEG